MANTDNGTEKKNAHSDQYRFTKEQTLEAAARTSLTRSRFVGKTEQVHWRRLMNMATTSAAGMLVCISATRSAASLSLLNASTFSKCARTAPSVAAYLPPHKVLGQGAAGLPEWQSWIELKTDLVGGCVKIFAPR